MDGLRSRSLLAQNVSTPAGGTRQSWPDLHLLPQGCRYPPLRMWPRPSPVTPQGRTIPLVVTATRKTSKLLMTQGSVLGNLPCCYQTNHTELKLMGLSCVHLKMAQKNPIVSVLVWVFCGAFGNSTVPLVKLAAISTNQQTSIQPYRGSEAQTAWGHKRHLLYHAPSCLSMWPSSGVIRLRHHPTTPPYASHCWVLAAPSCRPQINTSILSGLAGINSEGYQDNRPLC